MAGPTPFYNPKYLVLGLKLSHLRYDWFEEISEFFFVGNWSAVDLREKHVFEANPIGHSAFKWCNFSWGSFARLAFADFSISIFFSLICSPALNFSSHICLSRSRSSCWWRSSFSRCISCLFRSISSSISLISVYLWLRASDNFFLSLTLWLYLSFVSFFHWRITLGVSAPRSILSSCTLTTKLFIV